MKKNVWLVVAAAIILIGIWFFWGSYNKLVTKSEQVDNAWAQVETQYQRRYDLIPNLVSSVKGVLTQEQTVFGELARARENYSGAKTVGEKVAATSEVEGALSRLLVIVEAYPDLKSNETVQTLMAQLEGTENRVSVERARFNEVIKDYNLSIKRFPTNILARMYGFFEKSYFESALEAVNAPQVNLDLTK